MNIIHAIHWMWNKILFDLGSSHLPCLWRSWIGHHETAPQESLHRQIGQRAVSPWRQCAFKDALIEVKWSWSWLLMWMKMCTHATQVQAESCIWVLGNGYWINVFVCICFDSWFPASENAFLPLPLLPFSCSFPCSLLVSYWCWEFCPSYI